MINKKEISTWDSYDIIKWLRIINMDEYISKFESNKINGYDLIYLNNEDLNSLGIVNVHDKNILLKSLKKLLLENLKLTLNFEGKTLTVQLEFDPYYTVGQLTTELKNIFQTSSNIFIITNSNEILMSNLKIIDLILFNTHTYKNFKIVTGEQLTKIKNIEETTNNNYIDDNNLIYSRMNTINNNTEKPRNFFLNDYHKPSNKPNKIVKTLNNNNITEKQQTTFNSKISNKKKFNKLNESSKSCNYSQKNLKINDKLIRNTKNKNINEDDLLIRKIITDTNFNENYTINSTKNKNIKYNTERNIYDDTNNNEDNEDIKLKNNEYNFHNKNNEYFNIINERSKNNNIVLSDTTGNRNQRMGQDYKPQ